MRSWIRSEAAGFSGGVWVLWNDVDIGVKLRVAHKFFLHMTVSLTGDRQWLLTAVYASPQSSAR